MKVCPSTKMPTHVQLGTFKRHTCPAPSTGLHMPSSLITSELLYLRQSFLRIADCQHLPACL